MKSLHTFISISILTLCATSNKSQAQNQWKHAGTGMWQNCPIAEANGAATDATWAVEFETDSKNDNLYRTAPYCKGWHLQQQLGFDPSAYAIIDASDPTHVFITEFDALGLYTTSQLVAENGWAGQNEYGTLAGRTITFPAESFSLRSPLGWQTANLSGAFAITLPDNAGIYPTTITTGNNTNSTLPTAYFNMQGMPIKQPVPGQPIIRRQGTTVTKTIFH